MNWTNIILIVAIAMGLWVTSLIVCRMISKQSIRAWAFITMAISWTIVITYYLGLWR